MTEGPTPDDDQRVLPLVVRVERASVDSGTGPPTRTDALEAAARAVLLMVTTDDEAWRAAVVAWEGHHIRKVVRRARGAAWQRACALEGLTVRHGTAEVRVHPPVPLDGWPPDLARLQVGGTELQDDAPPADVTPGTALVLLTPHAEMTAGKAMAQAGHAVQLGLRAMAPADAETWRAGGHEVAVRRATPARWDEALRAGAVVVHDGGFTEVEPGTATALFTRA